MTPVLLLTVTAALALLLVWAVRAYALRHDVLDRPNARSSHTRPTPRGGGLGLVAALLLVLLAAAPAWRADARLLAAAGAILLTAYVGWRDDHGGLPVRQRLVAHLAAGLLVLPLALRPEAVPAWLGWGAAAWWVFWTVSCINVVNFMDGIDGLIGGQALVVGLHAMALGGDATAATFGAALAGAAAGFLAWNWSPARIFLGDVGSGALGVAAVVAGLLLMREGEAGLVTAFLPLFPIFLDAFTTLVRRWRRGEQLTEAHRSHLYQRLANGGWGHAPVSALFLTAAALGALPAHLPPGRRWPAVAAYLLTVAAVGAALDRRAAPSP